MGRATRRKDRFWEWSRRTYLWWRAQPDFVKRIDRWSSRPPAPKPGTGDGSGSDEVHVLVEGQKVKVDVSGPSSHEPAKGGAESKPDPLGTGTLKFLAAAAAGVGTVSAIIAVGAAVLWIRFNEAGIPAMQAVGVQPKSEALVQGGQQTAIFLLMALIAVLLIFFADPRGHIRRITICSFAILLLLAASFAVSTHLSFGWKMLLIALAVILLLGCAIVGLRTQERFWPLAVAVFVAALVFSSASALLIAEQQRFVQAVAILRGPDDTGLKGVYVAAGDDTLYFARPTPIPTDDSKKLAMMDVPREGAIYAVGPLESHEKAWQRARVMLVRLIEDADRAGDEGSSTAEGDSGEQGAQAEAKPPPSGQNGGSSASSRDLPEQVLGAFDGHAVVAHEVLRSRLCLVRYGDASRRPYYGRWWTSCREAERLDTVEEVRERLALPNGRFQGSYDMKIAAVASVGDRFLFMRGRAAPQCEHDPGPPCGREFPGGGVQYFVAEPKHLAISQRECTSVPEGDPSEWGLCPH
jgi:hypothetical protein